jgi:transposase, IS5 family
MHLYMIHKRLKIYWEKMITKTRYLQIAVPCTQGDYSGKPISDLLNRKNIINKIHEKGYKGNPLSDKQKDRNRKKSKTRARVEHVFGFMENSMNGMYLRVIGHKRVNAMIGLMNLTYNMFRYMVLVKN